MRDVLPLLGHVDAMVTDPPYGLDLGVANNRHRTGGYGAHLGKQAYRSYEDTYANFCTEIVPRLNMALDRVPRAAVFTGPHIHEQRKPEAIGGIYLPQGGGRTPWGTKNFLPVLLYGIPPGAGQHRPTVLVDASRPEPSIHPCPKPLAYMRWLVQLATRPGEVVLDPFMGSGTTGVACLALHRPFVGIEIDEVYWCEACQQIDHAFRQGDFLRPAWQRPQQLTLTPSA